MSDQICLKWNSFLNNIATSFESLWEEEGLVDVTLASDGQCLTAHKVILSASSPFFKKVFQANPCQHPVIVLQDIRFTELEALLIFIYKGEVNIEEKKLPALLKAAETLQIRGLTGNDAFAKDSAGDAARASKRFVQPERSTDDRSPPAAGEEPPKRKKVKTHKVTSDSAIETVPTTRVTRSSSSNDALNAEKNIREVEEEDPADRDPLEMKVEPLDVAMEEFDKSDQDDIQTDRLEHENPLGIQGPSSRPTIRVIAEATNRDKSPGRSNDEEVHQEKMIILENKETMESDGEDQNSDYHPSSSSNSTYEPSDDSADNTETAQAVKEPAVYPPFPCPFCDKAYTSWGFRRRHIKAVHTTSPNLHCKWCFEVLPTHAAWKRHVVSLHNLSADDAQNGLLILEEAHMVLQSADPTKLNTLHNIIHQNSQQFPDYRE